MISNIEIKEKLLPLVKRVAKDYLPSEKGLKDDYIIDSMIEKHIVWTPSIYSQVVVGVKNNKLVVVDADDYEGVDDFEYVDFEHLTTSDLSNLLTQILMQ